MRRFDSYPWSHDILTSMKLFFLVNLHILDVRKPSIRAGIPPNSKPEFNCGFGDKLSFQDGLTKVGVIVIDVFEC